MATLRMRLVSVRAAASLLALAAILFVALGLLAQGAAAAGSEGLAARPDPAKGKQLAEQVCGACHNADGNSVVAANPRLAGLDAAYIVKQLTDLARPSGDKDGRESPVMGGFAASLTPADRRDVAAWFSAQAPAPGTASGADDVQLGQSIFRAGLPAKAVPACAGCHGPAGDGNPVLYPRIGGQHADYIEAQLRAFRGASRRNSLAMEQIAFRLSDAEIKALADFVSGLRAQ